MLKVESGIKLGDVYHINYSNDEYSFLEFLQKLFGSRTVIDSVVVNNKENNMLCTTLTYEEFQDPKTIAHILESTLGPEETFIRLIGSLDDARISITLDPEDMSMIGFTSNSKQAALGDVLGIA